MFQKLTLAILLATCVFAVWFPIGAWVIVFFVEVSLLLQFFSAKRRYKFKDIPELSAAAKDLLGKYAHYYTKPSMCRDLGASASTLQFGALVLAAICVVRNFPLAVLFGIVNWLVMSSVAVGISPVALLSRDTSARLADDEITNSLGLLKAARDSKE